VADFETQETTEIRVKEARADVWLGAGQKLTDIAGIVALAQRTCPPNKHLHVQVTITAQIGDGDVPEGSMNSILVI